MGVPVDIFSASFGIGTFLTNDFTKVSTGGKEKSKALNMVIKLASIEGKPCVKISDDLMKVSSTPSFLALSTHTLFGSLNTRRAEYR